MSLEFLSQIKHDLAPLQKRESPSPTARLIIAHGEEILGKHPWVQSIDSEGNRTGVHGKKFAMGWNPNAIMYIDLQNSVPYNKGTTSAGFLFFDDGDVFASVTINGRSLKHNIEPFYYKDSYHRWGNKQVGEDVLQKLQAHLLGVKEPFEAFIMGD